MSSTITNLATCNDELIGPNSSTVLKDSIAMSLEKLLMIKLHSSEHEIRENCSTRIEEGQAVAFLSNSDLLVFIVAALRDIGIPYIRTLTIHSTLSAKKGGYNGMRA
uniref:Uncharacterized protein n=1 Tax=Quercus lobata TaxID=97700 RepID=A0A7N2MR98_QUELO